MSVLDKLVDVKMDPSTVVNTGLRKRILDTAELLNKYLFIMDETQKKFLALEDEQHEVIAALNPSMNRTYQNFFQTEYLDNDGFNVEEFAEKRITNFINWTVTAINAEYNINFEVESRKMVKDFVENGVDVDKIFVELVTYLGGKTFEQILAEETFNKIWTQAHRSYAQADAEDTLTKNTWLTVNKTGNEITWSHFVSFNDWGYGSGRMSSRGESNLYALTRYFRVILKEQITFLNAINVGLGEPFSPTVPSIVKSIRVFKNGNMKILFKDAEGCNVFLQPLRDKLEEIIS